MGRGNGARARMVAAVRNPRARWTAGHGAVRRRRGRDRAAPDRRNLCRSRRRQYLRRPHRPAAIADARSEEHTSELQSLMRISYAVFCLKKNKTKIINTLNTTHN